MKQLSAHEKNFRIRNNFPRIGKKIPCTKETFRARKMLEIESNYFSSLCLLSSRLRRCKRKQGCQIVSWHNIPKREKLNKKNSKWPQKTSNGYKNTNISSPKTLQNITKLGFSVCKNTIWQP
jgi:hypothetical protein